MTTLIILTTLILLCLVSPAFADLLAAVLSFTVTVGGFLLVVILLWGALVLV